MGLHFGGIFLAVINSDHLQVEYGFTPWPVMWVYQVRFVSNRTNPSREAGTSSFWQRWLSISQGELPVFFWKEAQLESLDFEDFQKQGTS